MGWAALGRARTKAGLLVTHLLACPSAEFAPACASAAAAALPHLCPALDACPVLVRALVDRVLQELVNLEGQEGGAGQGLRSCALGCGPAGWQVSGGNVAACRGRRPRHATNATPYTGWGGVGWGGNTASDAWHEQAGTCWWSMTGACRCPMPHAAWRAMRLPAWDVRLPCTAHHHQH